MWNVRNMLKLRILSLMIILGCSFLAFNLETSSRKVTKYCYGYLKIDRINFNKCVYEMDNNLNSLKHGLEVLRRMPYVVVGHSGHGYNALFNDLDQVNVGDILEFKYDNAVNYYSVKEKINYPKNKVLQLKEDLVLATCSQKVKTEQIIIFATKIDPKS